MAQYPRRQCEVLALVDQMISGLTAHPADFPHADKAALEAARAEFLAAGAALQNAQAAASVAARRKLLKFEALTAVMKQQIKQAQVDCCEQPLKLTEIGWGPRRDARNIEPPAQPGCLSVRTDDNGSLTLTWGKNARHVLRPVRCWQVYRRLVNESTNGEGWCLAGTALDNAITLTNEPIGQKMQYRITARNAAGESSPSNTVTITL